MYRSNMLAFGAVFLFASFNIFAYVPDTPSSAPTATDSTPQIDELYRIKWPSDSNTIAYQLQEKVGSSGSWSLIAHKSGLYKGIIHDEEGKYYYRYRRVNLDGYSGYSPTKTVTIEAVNNPPNISSISNKTIDEGEYISITPSASDPDGDNLSFSISNKPSWASFTSSSGRLRGTPDYQESGTYSSIKITASDGDLSDTETYSITVNNVLDTASLVSPSANETISGSLCFNWEAAEGANYYTVQVSSSTAFDATGSRWVLRDLTSTNACWSSSFIANDTAGSTPSILPSGEYYWRMKTLDNDTFSPHNAEFSGYRKFIILIGTPSAPNGPESVDVDTEYSISWSAVSDATSYKLYEDGTLVDELSGRTYDFTQLNTGTHSYTVSACNTTGCSAQSASHTVTIKAASTVKGRIGWISQDGDDHYLHGWACQTYDSTPIDVQVWAGGAADSGTRIAIATADEASEDAVATECSSDGTHHRFKVLFSDEAREEHGGERIYVHGVSNSGTTNTLLGENEAFYVPDELVTIEAPVLVSPAEAAPLTSEICLDWNTATDASYYNVQVSSDNNFNESSQRWVLRDQADTSACWNSQFVANATAGVTPEVLPNGTYYWRVKSMDSTTFDNPNVAFSEHRSFVVNALPVQTEFSWDVSEPTVGQSLVFSWDISNVASCTGSLGSDDTIYQYAASGVSTPQVYYLPGTYLTQWYCTDLSGNRFPEVETEFIEASVTVSPLAAPQNLSAAQGETESESELGTVELPGIISPPLAPISAGDGNE